VSLLITKDGTDGCDRNTGRRQRVFAGDPDETVFLTFADEAEAIEALGAFWVEPN
jgi:hypothetical protein